MIVVHGKTSGLRPSSCPDGARTSPAADAVQAVARAIMLGSTVRAGGYVVSRYEPLSDGWTRYACRESTGVVEPAHERVDRFSSLYSRETIVGFDWSAFGAASVFVARVGPVTAVRAARRVDGSKRK